MLQPKPLGSLRRGQLKVRHGRFFPYERAIQCLQDPMLHQQDDEYAIQKRYMGLESIVQLNGNPKSDCLLRRHWPDVRGDPS